MSFVIFIVVILVGSAVQKTNGYATYFTMSLNCDKHLTSGTKLMGNNVVTGNSRSVVVTRGSDVVINGAEYVPGETLIVTLTPTDTQFAFELLLGNAAFVDGSCSNTRTANSVATLTMPTSGNVQLVAGSASQHGTVSLTETFTLTAPVVDTTVGLATVMPTLLVMAPIVNIVSIDVPTIVSTVDPTTLSPTSSPSVPPSTASTSPTSSSPVTLVPSAEPSTAQLLSATPSFAPTVSSLAVTPSVIPSVISSAVPIHSTEPSVNTARTTDPSTASTVTPSQDPSLSPVAQRETSKPTPQPTIYSTSRLSVAALPTNASSGSQSAPSASTSRSPSVVMKALQPEVDSPTTTPSSSATEAASLSPSIPTTQLSSTSPSVQSVEVVVSSPSSVSFEPTSPAPQSLQVSLSGLPTVQSTPVVSTQVVQSSAPTVVIQSSLRPTPPPIMIVVNTSPPTVNVSVILNVTDSHVELPVTTTTSSSSNSASPANVQSDTSAQTFESTLKQHSTQRKLLIGITVTGGGVMVLTLASRYYLRHYRRCLQYNWSFCVALTAVLFAVASVVQMTFWARNSPTTGVIDPNYLGAPRWRENLFAYHPLLMVCGFLGAQIMAINDWNILRSHRVAKVVHIVVQTAGMCALGAGLYVVVKLNLKSKLPALTTIHSWLGVSAAAVFTFNYTLGWFMGIITACYPHSILRRALDMKRIHRAAGLTSLGLTVMSVASGVMDRLPEGSCFYALPEGPHFGGDLDPASHFSHLFTSCKLAHGLVVTSVLAAAITVLGVSLRNDPYQRKTVLSTQGSVVAMELENIDTDGEYGPSDMPSIQPAGISSHQPSSNPSTQPSGAQSSVVSSSHPISDIAYHQIWRLPGARS